MYNLSVLGMHTVSQSGTGGRSNIMKINNDVNPVIAQTLVLAGCTPT